MEEQKPSIGRIVHYKPEGDICFAAMITMVHADTTVDLTIFPGGKANSYPLISVSTKQWHWPERV